MIDKELLKLLGKNKKYLVYIVALMVLSLFANVGVTACIVKAVATVASATGALGANAAGTSAYAASEAVDAVSSATGVFSGTTGTLVKYFAIAAVCMVLRFVFDRIAGGLKDELGRNAKKQLREQAYDKITHLGMDATKDLGMAGLTQVCLEGIEQLDLYYSSYIPQFFYCMMAPFVLFFICLPICWQSAVVLILLVPLIPVSIIAVSRYAKKIFAKYWGKYISMGGEFLDGVSGLEVLKVFRADGLWHKRLNESSEEFRKITMKVLIMQLASTTIMDTVAYGGAALGITAAILSMNLWGLSPMKALFIVLVAVDFFLPLRAFGSAFHVAMNGASAGKKLLGLLNLPEPEFGEAEVSGDGASVFTLQLENVTFSYDGSQDAVKDATMTFETGKLTGIVGQSGCGKSTVVGLLEGVLRPQSGHVLINGLEPKKVSREDYYKHLAVVSYNTYLFNESVIDNFRLARPDITEKDVYAALQKVRMDEVIRERGGLGTVISEDATNLSGGQRQRLCLAVSLAADKDIYILDEATSNIDIESETIIMDAIRGLSKTKNVIVISHRLENVKEADLIYFMEAGRVAESGTHEELMRLGGGYKTLYETQKALEFHGAESGNAHQAIPISNGKTSDSETVQANQFGTADGNRTETSTRKHSRPWPVIVAKLLSLIGSLAGIIFLAVLGGSVGSLLALSVTLMGAVAVAKALGASVTLSYGAIIALCIVFGLLRGALRFAEQYSNHFIAFKLLAVLRDKIFGALRVLCPAKLESKQKGSIIAMITSDIETLEVFYAHTISPVCIAFVNAVFVFLFNGFVASFKIALVALLGYLVIGVLEPVIAQKLTREAGAKYRAEFASFNAYFLDSIKGIRDIILYGACEPRKEEVNQRSETLLAWTKKIKTQSVVTACVCSLTVSVFILLALGTGLSGVLNGELAIGPMLIGVVAVFGSFGPVISLANLPANLTQTFASGDRVLDLMEEEPVVKEIIKGKDFEFDTLAVEDLSFAYPETNGAGTEGTVADRESDKIQKQKVLNDITLSVEKGQIVGIVGPSGCGKSTLLKLLLRFWKKDGGSILYNGTDIEKVRTDSLLDNVTMVQQNTYLFNVTIRENLLLAKQDATQKELEEACRMASIHDFIMTLPEGYDTPVGELGGRLSAGEKQRIGLARAFLSGADLILLDEPTSNVDSINEGIILRSLEAQKQQKSFILVSHRESTMAIADKVYRF